MTHLTVSVVAKLDVAQLNVQALHDAGRQVGVWQMPIAGAEAGTVAVAVAADAVVGAVAGAGAAAGAAAVVCHGGEGGNGEGAVDEIASGAEDGEELLQVHDGGPQLPVTWESEWDNL